MQQAIDVQTHGQPSQAKPEMSRLYRTVRSHKSLNSFFRPPNPAKALSALGTVGDSYRLIGLTDL
jgi:hypothetical protein